MSAAVRVTYTGSLVVEVFRADTSSAVRLPYGDLLVTSVGTLMNNLRVTSVLNIYE